jgi:hypothetical protein
MGRLSVYWGQIMPSSLTSCIFSLLHTLHMTLRSTLRSMGFPNLIHAACMLFGPAALFLNLSIAISTSSVVGLFNHSFLSSSSSNLFLGLILYYFKLFFISNSS